MDDLEFIKRFSKITIKKICKKASVSTSNLYTGRVSKEKLSLMRKLIEQELNKLNKKDDKNE